MAPPSPRAGRGRAITATVSEPGSDGGAFGKVKFIFEGDLGRVCADGRGEEQKKRRKKQASCKGGGGGSSECQHYSLDSRGKNCFGSESLIEWAIRQKVGSNARPRAYDEG